MNPATSASNDQPVLRGALITFILLATIFVVGGPATSAIAVTREPLNQVRLLSIDGKQFTLAGLKGKVVVLDFFGMRCAHSRDHIRETMTKFSPGDFGRGLQLIGVESEASSAANVRQFVRDQGIEYPVVQIDEATFIRLVNSRNLSAPQTLVYGRDGKLLLHTLGFSEKNEADIRAAIQKALDVK